MFQTVGDIEFGHNMKNIMIDIVRLRISIDNMEIETLNREGTSLIDVGS